MALVVGQVVTKYLGDARGVRAAQQQVVRGNREVTASSKQSSAALTLTSQALTTHAARQAQLSSSMVNIVRQMQRFAADLRKLSASAGADAGLKSMSKRASQLTQQMSQATRTLKGYAAETRRTAAASRSLASSLTTSGQRARQAQRSAWDPTSRSLRQMTHEAHRTSGAIARIFEFAGGAVLALAFTNLLQNMRGFVRSAIDSAARTVELDAVLETMGRNARVSTLALREQTDAITALGIESGEAQEAVAKFLRFGLDINKASELARVAQDVAVISRANSTETFARLIYGATSRQTEVLRTAGVNVSFERAFADYATSVGKTVKELSETEKQQAGLNAVIESGVQVAGAYEAAQEQAGKAIRSTSRYVNELKVAIGSTLLPIYDALVFTTNDALKVMMKTFGAESDLALMIRRWATSVAAPINEFRDRLKELKDTGLDFSGLTRTLSQVADVLGRFGPLAAALGVGGLARFASQLGGLGRLVAPLAGVQGVLVTLVATNESLREAAKTVLGALVKGAATLAQAAAPIFEAINTFIADMGPTVQRLADDMADIVGSFAALGAVLLRSVTPMVVKVLELAASLAERLSESQAAMNLLVTGVAAFTAVKFLGAIAAMVAAMQAATVSATAMWAAISGPVALAAIGIAAAAIAIGLALDDIASNARSTQLAYNEAFDSMAEEHGLGAAIARTRVEMEGLRRDSRAMADEIERNSDSLGTATRKWVPFIRMLEDYAGLPSVRGGATVGELSGETQREESIRLATERQIDALRNQADRVTAEAERTAKDIQTSIEVIERVTRANAASFIPDLADLGADQIKMIEEQITSFVQVAEKWGTEVTSFAGALLQQEVVDGQALMDHYANLRAQVEHFWYNLQQLSDLGLNQSAIRSLVEQGPLKVGGGIADLLRSDPTELAAAIAQLNDDTTAIQTAIDESVRTIARSIIAREGELRTTSVTEAKILAERYVELRSVIADEAAALSDSYAALEEMASAGAAAPAATYRQNSEALLSVLQDENATLAQVLDARQRYVDAKDKLILSAWLSGDDLAPEIATVDKVIEGLLSYRQEMFNAARTLGLDSVGGFSSANDNAFVAGFNVANAWKAGLAAGGSGAGEVSALMGLVGDVRADTAPPQRVPKPSGPAPSYPPSAAQQAAAAAAASARRQAEQQARQARQRAQRLAKIHSDHAERVADIMARTDPAAAIASVMASIEPLQVFNEAMTRSVGNLMSFEAAQDSTADATDSLASRLAELAGSTDSVERTMRSVRSEVRSALAAIQAEAVAAAEAGAIHDDAASITAYMITQVDELAARLPQLAQEFLDGAASAETLATALQRSEESLEGLGNLLSATSAVFSTQDALSSLKQAYQDQVDLLTNSNLSIEHEGIVRRRTSKQLVSYVQALRQEALALARAGKIGSDAASVQAHILAGLEDAQMAYPHLASEIADYAKTLKAVPGEVNSEATFTVTALVAQAMTEIERFRARAAQIPPSADFIIQVRIDEALAAAAEQRMAALGDAQRQLDRALADFHAQAVQDLVDVNAGLSATERNVQGLGVTHRQYLVAAVLANLAAQTATDLASTVVTGIIGALTNLGTRVDPYQGYGQRVRRDDGGILPPGVSTVVNATGNNEFILRPDQLAALSGVGGRQVTIEKMIVTSDRPAREFFDEGIWRGANLEGIGS